MCSACAPRAATTRSSKAPWFPIDTWHGWSPQERPGSIHSSSASSRGRFSGLATSTTRSRRALDLTVESVKSKRSIGLSRSMAYHPEVQHRVADMGLALEGQGDPGSAGGGNTRRSGRHRRIP